MIDLGTIQYVKVPSVKLYYAFLLLLFLHTLRDDGEVKYLIGYLANEQTACTPHVGLFHLLRLP